ncbi:MAG: hypothetical protein COT34_01285 [Candidatus Nealsonbacteria bacterium CG08_land_8_20_14_0_20_43_11]|uniref:Homing endonuclease LAGLIDADG domain-containing protein n=1 Tax=Candidatus Nealsonbacteria bacterium CG08_land_8_20_14_0_20_43_11 TaxID=1974706 RepID=A0A2M6T0T6_9BACT|nr:MAG: hypothetical protein COT34_01285 [Candidatus Nealsonbacteria bacterium CG08_land_8_20_14_0_20_43_11]
MKLRLEDKRKAIELRVQGKTFGEIRSIIPNLSKSTLSGWLRNVELTKGQKEALLKNIKRVTYGARVRAGRTKRIENEKKNQEIMTKAGDELPSLIKNPLFLVGLVLYWAEGTRKSGYFRFTNSDPEIIKIMVKWLREIFQIPEEKIRIRIYIHKIYSHENCEKFWSRITNIPLNRFLKTIYKPTPHKIKKNQEYKGCVQINVGGINFYLKLRGLINKLSKTFNGA